VRSANKLHRLDLYVNKLAGGEFEGVRAAPSEAHRFLVGGSGLSDLASPAFVPKQTFNVELPSAEGLVSDRFLQSSRASAI
jgi:hypothetical protein